MITRVQKVERRNEPPPAARLVNIKLTNCQPNQPLLGHQVEPAASRQARCPHARLDCCDLPADQALDNNLVDDQIYMLPLISLFTKQMVVDESCWHLVRLVANRQLLPAIHKKQTTVGKHTDRR